ncbi:glycosyltransferase family 15 protein [Hypoxylon trugodes]|uniref:glycosyltransferase family 15 protein n=1 Tax=Hypoxylon trugodes TaxID=326681 RepID=UPI00219654A9|nr:glycosyltransferase family 15 protein [Hypoxylon trugodes]KAI1394155.1 glycosyltransferase family 15 protein [Hypoxylon trugodes]
MLRRIIRPARRLPIWLFLSITAPFLFEVILHVWRYRIPRPASELDTPFFTSCQEPDISAKRENAVLVMLARNHELEKANKTITSIERQFNKWFNYPILFLNDAQWDPKFIEVLNTTSRGLATFEVIPQDQWTFPKEVDVNAAKQSIKEQGEQGIPHAGEEGYHHMCRFYSGKFYELDAMKKYKWYWRLEPDVNFSCAITYDPFVQMARHKKVYGFTIALWEVGKSCPGLFRSIADWKEMMGIPTNNLWKAMITPSWVPFPFRRFMSWLPHRDAYGDEWSLCHYWSNFEIADMDFFRTRAYQDLFEYLDKKGGFYFERWGDAAVHSLAVALLVDPRKVHHFEDFGYRHDHLYQCPANAPGGQLPDSPLLGSGTWAPEMDSGIGCRCECDGREPRNYGESCIDKLKQPTTVKRSWFPWVI